MDFTGFLLVWVTNKFEPMGFNIDTVTSTLYEFDITYNLMSTGYKLQTWIKNLSNILKLSNHVKQWFKMFPN